MRLSELTDGLHRGILSSIQVHIFLNRYANLADWTYARIRETYGIKRNAAIPHALLRTSCGLFWDPGMGGGHDPYLSPLGLPTFLDHVLARAAELNYITRCEALFLPSKQLGSFHFPPLAHLNPYLLPFHQLVYLRGCKTNEWREC
jgi:hypothetical protein